MRSGNPHNVNGQRPHCCGRPMWGHGRRSKRRFYCPVCRSTSLPEFCLRIIRTERGWQLREGTEGLKVWRDAKGRACVTLPSRHPYANSAGFQRLARFLIAEALGYLPRSDEHTHHVNGELVDDRIDNLELVAIEYHGRLHASAAFVGRGKDGKFIERNPHEKPPEGGYGDWPRDRAILGNAVRRAAR
jgi:hypothetical protein